MAIENIGVAQRITFLVSRFLAGSLTESEVQELEIWKAGNKANQVLFDELTNVLQIKDAVTKMETVDAEVVLLRLKRKMFLPTEQPHKPGKSIFYRYAAAVAAVLVLGLFILFYANLKYNQEQRITAVNDLAPGKNHATLTLSDGKSLVLNDLGETEVRDVAGITISKKAGALLYRNDEKPGQKAPLFNILSTAKGEQYQLVLADGTRVWLNAYTSLKYPTAFSGQNRVVELNGEAYFEVSKDAAHPFIVNSAKQQVKVLGTHFNINTYEDEKQVKTTLLEGAVQVSGKQQRVRLVPGQQAQLADNGLLQVMQVNADLAIDWKNGEFRFDKAPLPDILRKISRWYNVKIEYQQHGKEIPTFSGAVSRSDKVSSILNMLEKAGDVRFTMDADGTIKGE